MASTSNLLTKKEITPDIIFDMFTVKTPSQNGFTLYATAKKAKVFKQTQTIFFTDLSCVCRKNNIFFGSINAQAALVDQKSNKIRFDKPQTELNLSSDIQQTP